MRAGKESPDTSTQGWIPGADTGKSNQGSRDLIGHDQDPGTRFDRTDRDPGTRI